jgi:nucleoside-diphosphate-sugar epimerase
MTGPTLPEKRGKTGDNPLSDDLDQILDDTGGLWEELREKRLFITGGTGFFGSWLLESLAWANYRFDLNVSAVILTRDYAAFKKNAPHLACNPSIRFHTGDVRDFIFPEGEFSHIIHAAATPAIATFNRVDPQVTFDVILEGARHALEFAARCGARKFLLVSSGAVYGTQPSDMTHIPEDYLGAPDSSNPDSFLGESKRAAECLGALYSEKHNLDVKIARCFSFVGPYLPMDVHYAIGNFIRDALNGGPILVKGDGTSYRSYLYAADLAAWLWTILVKGESCQPYNIGSEEDVTIAELADMIAKSCHRRIEVKIAKPPVPGRQPERYVPSTKRTRMKLGLRQSVNLREAIERTMAYHLAASSILADARKRNNARI